MQMQLLFMAVTVSMVPCVALKAGYVVGKANRR